MPLQPFLTLFVNWDSNFALSLERLRLKAITLFALAAMLRPSDVAPGSGHKFTRQNIQPLESGALQIYLHHIKNDRDRDGFCIILQPSKQPQMCPVDALNTYLMRTMVQAGGPAGPVFISLVPPYWALCAGTVAGILNWAIELAGLDSSIYSAKNFRPTGATTAIDQGMNSEQVRALGRWKNQDTFLKHYVHSQPSTKMTDAILCVIETSG